MSKNLIQKLDNALNSGELFQFVDDSYANTQVLLKLGFSAKGQYVGIVAKYLVDNDVDTSHFTSNGLPKVGKLTKQCINCGVDFQCIPRKTKEQVTCSRACSNTYFRSGENNGNYIDSSNRYREKALKEYGYTCQRCGYAEHKAAIVVHHKDHDRSNADISNLEVLCANCHAIHHWSTNED